MKHSILFLCVLGSLVGCSGTPPQPSGSPVVSASTSSAQAPAPVASASVAQVTEPVKAVYKSCAVYAAATDYEFEKAGGEKILVRESNVPAEKTIIFQVNLVDDTAGLEGPPGAAVEWVGKEFLLTYGPDGKVAKVETVEMAPATP